MKTFEHYRHSLSTKDPQMVMLDMCIDMMYEIDALRAEVEELKKQVKLLSPDQKDV